MAKLKMVKGKTYAAPGIFGAEHTVNKGDIVVVADQAHVDMLLADSYTDALGNEHAYFVEVDSASADEADADTAKPAKPAARSRSKTA